MRRALFRFFSSNLLLMVYCLGSDVGWAFPYVDNVGYSVGVETNFSFAVESPNDAYFSKLIVHDFSKLESVYGLGFGMVVVTEIILVVSEYE